MADLIAEYEQYENAGLDDDELEYEAEEVAEEYAEDFAE